ncbi:HET-domain-containing protein [Xylariaceae sp. FL1651]|nr:HET-domain-containing protein [Xylariaceae sp. FL1651]
MLCFQCESLRSVISFCEDVDVAHYDTTQDLETNAKSGCRLCQVMSRACSEKSKDPNAPYNIKTKLIKNAGIELSLAPTQRQNQFEASQNSPRAIPAYVVFESYDLPDLLECVLIADDYNDAYTGSNDVFRLIAAWLNECLHTHGRCRQARAGAEQLLPHRVIDVGSVDEPYVYLLDTRARPVKGNYVTLSHCWGGGSPIMTTSDNIVSHEKGIRYTDLPPTFREAAHATRSLGCRYLWIDSLCIVQNDRKDWEVEAAMMCQYYQYSLLTIAAADGSGCTAGLFRKRDGFGYLPCVLQLGGNAKSKGRKVYAFTNSLSSDLKRSSLSESYKPNRLDTRAWVFQEQALSSRTLSYARDSVTWRCQEAVFDDRPPYYKNIDRFIKEMHSNSIITSRYDPRTIAAMVARLQREWVLTRSVPELPNDHTADSPNPDIGHNSAGKIPCFSAEDEFIIQWGNMISEYTRRGLTYQTDKLVAIQGVADALMSTHYGANKTSPKQSSLLYYAGAWAQTNRSLVLSLLWTTWPQQKQVRRAGEEGNSNRAPKRLDIAPSWSWASITQEVRWPGHLLHGLEPRLEIKHLVCKGTHAGELHVEANVKKAVFSRGTADGKGQVLSAIVDWTEEEGNTAPFTEQDDRATSALLLGPLPATNEDRTPYSVIMDEELGIDGEKLSVSWLVEVAVGDIQGMTTRRRVQCLVLQTLRRNWEVTESLKYTVCRRVGYCVFEEAKWKGGSASEMRRLSLCIV